MLTWVGSGFRIIPKNWIVIDARQYAPDMCIYPRTSSGDVRPTNVSNTLDGVAKLPPTERQ